MRMFRNMTHEEAGGHLCPLINNGCRGTDCMAWVWIEGPRRKVVIDVETGWDQEQEPSRPIDVPPHWEWLGRSQSDAEDPPCWIEPMGEAMLRRKGRCGLVPDK